MSDGITTDSIVGSAEIWSEIHGKRDDYGVPLERVSVQRLTIGWIHCTIQHLLEISVQ
jgi:hypothetical protein